MPSLPPSLLLGKIGPDRRTRRRIAERETAIDEMTAPFACAGSAREIPASEPPRPIILAEIA